MKRGFYILFTWIFIISNIISQSKGASPQPSRHSEEGQGEVYAVVVGISDYQDKEIPDLRFAHKDAEAFANYLRSSAGGSLDHDHLKVLMNEQATAAQFAIALDWLWEVVKEGDQVIIYFSGHGDVEKKSLTQPGYLLCWDAPSRVYLAGGALALPMFQDVISTLSVQNKAKVVVITDACRSGKLAGSSVGGSQITGANLAKQYANEIKILSCQPNEYSIEGEQWGGGRGAFSYHLIDALYGMADLNTDLIVSLQEAGRYLEDHVSAEVAPVSQVPMIIGNRTDPIAHVDVNMLASMKTGKLSQMSFLSSIDARGIEEEVLVQVDTSIKRNYRLFKQALNEKVFLVPDNACADFYYEQLMKEPKLSRLHSTLKRNYAAALQDDAQQAINRYMKADVSELSLSQKSKVVRYSDFPRQLARAANLLGQNHYLYRTLQARSAYFEGFPLIHGGEFTQDMIKRAALKFQESIHWDPNMPLALLGLAWIHGFGWAQADSAEYYTHKATINSPSWILPFVRLSEIYSTMLFDFVKSKEYLDRAAQIDSSSPLYWEAEGSFYFEQHRYSEAELIFKKIIENASSSICMPCAQNSLVKIYINTDRLPEAMELAKKLIISDSSNSTSHNTLGIVLTKMGKYKDAENEFRIAVQLSANQTNPEMAIYYWKAYIFLEQKI
ncbi:MAG: caspase family protein [Saprospiraceae bacterium]|nr:caspase family protein [Saprospiraceae bacterium]